MRPEEDVCRVAIFDHDSRFLHRKAGQRQSWMPDRVISSLRTVLDELGAERPIRLYLMFRLDPLAEVPVGSIKVDRFHSREQSLELTLALDVALPDDEVGPAVARMTIEAIELARRDLASRKVLVQIDATVARIQQWTALREWLVPVPPGSTNGVWPERLEIHAAFVEGRGAVGATDGMTPLEAQMDRILDGLGALESHEIGPDEWVTYVDCSDADAALAKLTPRLKDLRFVGSIYVLTYSRLKHRRVVIRQMDSTDQAIVPELPAGGGGERLTPGEAMEQDEWPERLEVHFQLTKELGLSGARVGIGPLEDEMDEILDGVGAFEGNEIGPDAWVTYIDCSDADAALERLTPRLKDLPSVGSIYVLKCSRVVIR